jgi:hypothetical protein
MLQRGLAFLALASRHRHRIPWKRHLDSFDTQYQGNQFLGEPCLETALQVREPGAQQDFGDGFCPPAR